MRKPSLPWVVFFAGALIFTSSICCLVGDRMQRAAERNRELARAVPTAIATAPAPAEARAAPENECDPLGASRAVLRDRLTGAQCVEMMLTLVNAQTNSARGIGWEAARSDSDGAPCVAAYRYELQQARRALRFAYVPGDPGRLVTIDNETGVVADECDNFAVALGVADAPVTEQQQSLALMFRMFVRRYAGDAYMHPREAGVLVVRRPHCVEGNVGMRGDPGTVRLLRRSGVVKLRCVGDATWEQRVPPRGTIDAPVLVQ